LKIIYNIGYKNSLKNLKKRHDEKRALEKIINHIENTKDKKELEENPISYIYNYEQLKYDLKDKYSFNLNKNRGKVRLIFEYTDNNTITLLYISIEHYKDYKK